MKTLIRCCVILLGTFQLIRGFTAKSIAAEDLVIAEKSVLDIEETAISVDPATPEEESAPEKTFRFQSTLVVPEGEEIELARKEDILEEKPASLEDIPVENSLKTFTNLPIFRYNPEADSPETRFILPPIIEIDFPVLPQLPQLPIPAIPAFPTFNFPGLPTLPAFNFPSLNPFTGLLNILNPNQGLVTEINSLQASIAALNAALAANKAAAAGK